MATKGGLTLSYNDASHPHAVTAMGDNSYSYDDNGGQTQRVIDSDGTYDLTYDGENRLVEVKKDSVVIASFVFDGAGSRVLDSVSGSTSAYLAGRYEYDITDSENHVKRSYYGGLAMRVEDEDTNNDVYFILSDHLGSTSLTLNSDGTVKSEMRYTAFGEVRHSSGSAPTDGKGDRPIALKMD